MTDRSRSRKSGFIRGGVSRRETLWLFMDETVTSLAAANSAALIISLNAAALALRPFTIVRTRGAWYVESDQSAAGESQHVGLGYAVVSDQASAIGVTAVPTPFTDDGSDLWFVYEEIMQTQEGGTTTEFLSPRGRFETFDSKAMRKVEDGQDMVIVLENSSLGDGVGVLHHARMLIKLH